MHSVESKVEVDMDVIEKRIALLGSEKVIDEIDKRYKECDEQGHRIVVDNQCLYCSRHEKYGISNPFLKQEMKEREKLRQTNPLNVPLDAAVVMPQIQQDRTHQELMDYLHAQGVVAKELYPEAFA